MRRQGRKERLTWRGRGDQADRRSGSPDGRDASLSGHGNLALRDPV